MDMKNYGNRMEVLEPKVNLYRKVVLKNINKSSSQTTLNTSTTPATQCSNSLNGNSQTLPKESPQNETHAEDKSNQLISEANKTDVKLQKTQESKTDKKSKDKKDRESRKSKENGHHKPKKRSRSKSRKHKDKKSKKSTDKRKKKKRSRSRSPEHRSKKKKSSIDPLFFQNKNMDKIVDKKRLFELAKMNATPNEDKNDPNFVDIFQTRPTPQPKLNFQRPIEKSIDKFVEFCKNLAKENSNETEINYLNTLQNEIETIKSENSHLARQQLASFEINKKVNDVITKLFPVSSGTQHRVVEEEKKDEIDHQIYVSTEKSENIISIVQEPLFKKVTPEEAQEIKIQNLGKYTGHLDAYFLTPEQLEGEYKAWTRKDLLKTAAPITEGIGKKLLEKMGWTQGQGLGKNREGPVEPIKIDVKLNRKGLEAEGLVKERTQKQIEGKHPVSCLLELCRARKWLDPVYETVEESGPAHQRNFLMKVTLNNVSYQPSGASSNKKLAKAMAAYVCLQAFGIQSVIPT